MSGMLNGFILMICFLAPTSSLAEANNSNIKDYGVRGHVFDIAEESIIEEIMNKLKLAEKEGTLQKLNEEFVAKVKVKVLRPNPVSGITKAAKDRSWTYDPTFTQEETLTDDKGRVIVAAGTKINALEKLKWGEALLFVDGDDRDQIKWVKSKGGKIVLTSGAPLEIADLLKRPVFFDQGGILCRRFKIEAVPAVIEQEGKLLKVSEVKI